MEKAMKRKRIDPDSIPISAEKYRLTGITLKIRHKLSPREQATLVDLLLQNLGMVTTMNNDGTTVIHFLPLEEGKPYTGLCQAARECLKVLFPNPREPRRPHFSRPRKLTTKELEQRALTKKQREFKKALHLKLNLTVAHTPRVSQPEWEKIGLRGMYIGELVQLYSEDLEEKGAKPSTIRRIREGLNELGLRLRMDTMGWKKPRKPRKKSD
jgi:hypothetical protein